MAIIVSRAPRPAALNNVRKRQKRILKTHAARTFQPQTVVFELIRNSSFLIESGG